ncbi:MULTISPECIES: HEPN-associated N-terminal domain-containing protein [unclassified Dyella]|uniref:HEPN-associated N-terminal domain-containing protein n=1 Tax=Dyella sp. ASV21 TaxID=2795114 RepID=UPI0018EA7D7A|nr:MULTISPECIES: HEPN-associated N-terminal domain-containing protein [unclassified Dyella]
MMGLVKSEWMEAQERGWSAPDTFVCADCVDDPHLKDLIKRAACADTCDYCGRSDVVDIAAESHVVMEAVYDTVHTYYCEPAAGGVPYDGGFVVPPIDVQEVLDNLGFDGHADFVEAVVDAEVNGDAFVPAANGHWAGSHPHEVLSSAWSLFTHTVKHETRFHFADAPRSESTSPYEIDVADVLPAIAQRLRPLIRTLPAGTDVYRSRVRSRGQAWLPGAKELGPPPKDKTSAGRMNPAGIPYLYTAFDKPTARREIGITGRTSHTVFTATFTLSKPLEVIDLTQLPPMPSLFDVANKEAREQALFIRAFVDTLSKPVMKDGHEHIDYVPSQVVCEYLAQVFEPAPGTKLGGLIYPSAVHPGGKNLVVFPEDRYWGTFHGVTFARAGK